MTATTTSLGELIARLKRGEIASPIANDMWARMIARTTVPGRVCEVDGETYDHFLEVLPPRWMGSGVFAFGEGADALRLFWAANTEHGRQYFCRQLDEAETRQFCRLAGVSLTSG
jgi:hypothetical protein